MAIAVRVSTGDTRNRGRRRHPTANSRSRATNCCRPPSRIDSPYRARYTRGGAFLCVRSRSPEEETRIQAGTKSREHPSLLTEGDEDRERLNPNGSWIRGIGSTSDELYGVSGRTSWRRRDARVDASRLRENGERLPWWERTGGSKASHEERTPLRTHRRTTSP